MTIANVEMAAAWDGEEGERWTAHAERYESASTRYWDALADAVVIRPENTVLDVGCGTGKSTLELAGMVPAGSVLGVDLSSQMLGRARRAAEAAGLANVTFEQADAQVHPFPEGAFDLAISVFGGMFFADPIAAFANIRRALRPGGRLALLAWRELPANEWVAALLEALLMGRDFPTPPAGAPGPFGLADRGHTERVLREAGFGEIEIEQVDEPVRYGDDADHAYAFVSTLGITKGLTRDLDDDGRAAALDALHACLVAHETEEGVLFRGSAWLVVAS